jgi:hypothetical protein
MNIDASQRKSALPHVAGAAALAALSIVLASWTGPGEPGAALDAAQILLSSMPLVIVWIAAALGYGWILQRVLTGDVLDRLSLQIALGVAALLVIDEACGSLGVMQPVSALGAWTILAIGIVFLALQIVKQRGVRGRQSDPHWLMWFAAPSVAVLLIAACSAPGVLWATEFGGYDALSYHLQLPKEWLALGRIQPLEHNVYSFLPGYVEAAYYHLAAVRGDAIHAAYSCQLLHAAITVLTAVVIARVASRWWNSAIGAAAAVVFLGTPWVVVVGSLAYSEMPAILMFVAAMSIVTEASMTSFRKGFAVGILGGAACGAKLTSVGMIVAPLIVAIVVTHQPRQWLRILAAMLLAGLIILAPYFLRNHAYSGNPLFPFATAIFGAAHWSNEQVAIWNRGHGTDASLPHRFAAFWNQFMRFGIGPSPSSEPWKPQWSIVPWLGIAGLAIALIARRMRGRSMALALMLLVQWVFWIVFTHLKSRFLLPAAAPLVLGACEAASWIHDHARRRIVLALAGLALIFWSIQPALVFRAEAKGAPAISVGAAAIMSGDALREHDRIDLGASTFPAVAMNYLLPDHATILSIGFATPFYVRSNIVYHTTWDRGTLAQLMREYPDDQRAWADHLRADGFTHLVVNENMLRIWERAGWNDLLLTAVRVRAFVPQYATLLYQYPDGSAIYRLDAMENTP